MLILLIHNDSTGPDHDANYDYEVRVNTETIARGRIVGHNRADGWQNLVAMLVEQSKTKG